MDESIRSFLKSVAIRECRVQHTPHYIFLCGGKTRQAGKFLSARDYFFRYLKKADPSLSKRIRLAEKINNWFDHNLFNDLLEVEEILADCADLTILFVESPGSIAELGAFASSSKLRSRTLAILNTEFDQERTFIADGPVRRIKSTNADFVRYWRWNPKDINGTSSLASFKDLSLELLTLIQNRSNAAPQQEILDPKSPGHTMFLIADLIDIVGISFRTEIIECLTHWEYTIDLEWVNKYLSLLEHFKLVRREPLSNQTYYLSRAQFPYIKYAFNPGAVAVDRERLKILIRSSLKVSDRRRADVLRRDIEDRTRRATRRS